MGKREFVAENEKFAQVSLLLRAIAHPLRLDILQAIDNHGVIYVKSLVEELEIEQSITSQHLGALKQVNLVESKRDGKFILYQLRYDKIQMVHDAVQAYLKKSRP